MNTRALVAAMVVAALVAIGAGCGGGDDSASTTAASPTKEEYIAQADQICSAGDAQIQAAGQAAGIGANSSEQETTDFVTSTVLPNIQDQLDQLQALTPPAGDEEQIAALIDGLGSALASAQDDPASLLSGTSTQFADVDKLAQDYGLTSCGDGG